MSNSVSVSKKDTCDWGSWLWEAADLLRSHIDVGDYKNYIFSLLFFKRLCDVHDEEYRKAILSCDPKILVELMKTIKERMDARLADGKKITASDAKYFHIAEEGLFGELAISLKLEKEKVKDYIKQNVEAFIS